MCKEIEKILLESTHKTAVKIIKSSVLLFVVLIILRDNMYKTGYGFPSLFNLNLFDAISRKM